MKKKKNHLKIGAAVLGILIAAALCRQVFFQGNGRFANAAFPSAAQVELSSRFALLMDAQTGQELFEKNAGQRAFPASLTKIMTALVAIEQNSDLEQTAMLSPALFGQLRAQNASMAGFEPGERVKLLDLLYGALLPSGAEAAIALAEHTSGSEQAFVSVMNQKANELGLSGTKFTNATGLHNQKHYSTARDMATLLQYALQNETFRTVFTSQRHTVAPTNCHPEGFTIYSTLTDPLENAPFPTGELLGGKTGYTDQAGLCLASAARSGGRELILVTMGAAGDPKITPHHLLDAEELYEAFLQ